MTVLDIVIIVVIGGLTLWGVLRGFIRALAGLVGLIAGIILIAQYASQLGEIIPPAKWSLMVRTLIAGCLILIGTVTAVRIIAWIARKTLVHGPLKMMDRILGGLVGFLKGVILIFVLLVIVSISPFERKVWEIADHSPVFKQCLAVSNPFIERYRDTFIKKVSETFMVLLPEDLLPPTEKTQKEIAELIRNLDTTADPDKRKALVEGLSDESGRYLQQLTKFVTTVSSDSTAFREIPRDLKWITDKLKLPDLYRESNR